MAYYRYMVLNKKGEYESYTGTFKTKDLALFWFSKYAKFHIKRGKILKLFKFDNETRMRIK